MIEIYINSILRTDITQDSISWVQNLTKDPSIISFSIRNTNQVLPNAGEIVELFINSSLEFRGTITEKNQNIESGILESVDYEAKDGVFTLDRKLVIKAYQNTQAHAIVLDIIANFTTGFTTTNVISPSPVISSIRFNYEQPSQAIRMIADAIGWDWFVDESDDLHFFPPNTNMAPFSLTDDNGNMIYNSLNLNGDILNLKNLIYVRGGKFSLAINEANSVDIYVADGDQVSFPLIYQYKSVGVSLNGSPLTIGVDFITDPTTVDVLYNFQEKSIKFRQNNRPSANDVVRVFGEAQVPLIVQAQDDTSIQAYGIFEHVIIDKSITSIQEAELRATAEMNAYAGIAYAGSFKTYTNGLKVGQMISINSQQRGINDTYKITSINARIYGVDEIIYDVKFLKSGEITFMDVMTELLGEKRKNIIIADDEVIQRLISLNESLGMTDELLSITTTSPPYTWQDPNDPPETNPITWNFFTWQ